MVSLLPFALMSATDRHECGPEGRGGWKMPELEGVDEVSQRAFRALLRTARLHFRTMFGVAADGRTHPGQAMCLRLLTVNDGASQREIAGMLHVAPPTVSKMLGAMERGGLVERRPDEADQRLTRVFLTRDGRERSHEIGTAVGSYVTAAFGALSERERRELTQLLEKLGESIAQVGADEDGR
jgi:MarR family transcriptional regulator, organic hydroperoxide resistance regulator